MSNIIAAYGYLTGSIGNTPNFQFLDTNDTPATVTTAGYLTHIVQEGLLQVKNSDLILVKTVTAGVISSIWYQVRITGTPPNLVYSLVGQTNSGGIFAGNVQAGSSGAAGHFISYPAGANLGTFSFTAANQGGNFASSLTNAALGQATTFTLPDPGAAAANVLVAGAALVNGNMIVSSGVAGQVADAGYALKRVAKVAVAGGAAAQVVVDAFVTLGSSIVASWNDTTNAVTIQTVTAAAGQFTVTSSGDPGASHLSYIVTK